MNFCDTLPLSAHGKTVAGISTELVEKRLRSSGQYQREARPRTNSVAKHSHTHLCSVLHVKPFSLAVAAALCPSRGLEPVSAPLSIRELFELSSLAKNNKDNCECTNH